MSLSKELRANIPELFAVARRAGKAIGDYKMIEAGDKVAVAVSGGKDSISLLHVLRYLQKKSPVKFEFFAVHVDFEMASFDPQPLIAYLEREGFPYCIEKDEILKGQNYDEIGCFWWSWNRRKTLFKLAEKVGFNKLAFGHHMDDIAETIILNQFYRGEIGAMRPNQVLFDGKMSVIRPLAYEREQTLRILAEKLDLKSIGGQSKCGSEEDSHRALIKKMLKDFEHDNPNIVKNIFRSLQNIKTDYLLSAEAPS